jgi:hypothetical protein
MDPQQLNSYSYARNNPITLSDPSGNASILAWVTNPLFTALQVGLWSGVVGPISGEIRGPLTQQLLTRSATEINPSSIVATQNNQYSSLTNAVKNSSEYNTLVSGLITKANKNGQTSISADMKGGSSGSSLNFTHGDLFTSIGGTLRTQVEGTKGSDGTWNLNTTIYDRYDFQPKGYSSPFVSATNNAGVASQTTGALSNYNIKIKVKDKIFKSK